MSGAGLPSSLPLIDPSNRSFVRLASVFVIAIVIVIAIGHARALRFDYDHDHDDRLARARFCACCRPRALTRRTRLPWPNILEAR